MPPGTTRRSAESAIKREFDAGRIERVAPGVYRLAPPKPAEPPKPAPLPEQSKVPGDGPTEEEWFAALEAWAIDSSSWDTEKLGPPPDQPNNIPPDIKARFNDRLRKRQERRREAEAAAAKRSAADADLHAKLIAVTGGNFQPGPALDDVAPIRLALEVVPLERILSAIRCKTDRKLYPKNEPATSWREDRLLREIAENYCRTDIVPRLVAAWAAAGKTLAKAQSSPSPDAPMADIDRSHHDDPSAPPGPHSVPQPDAAPDAPQELASAPEATPATTTAPDS